MSEIIIIGGGAAGLMAGVIASDNGAKVTIIEKNEKLGKKLFITGKGRCNVTNACDTDQLFSNIVTNSKFMYSSIYAFNNYKVMDLIEEMGCPLKTERADRVFPVSDKSSDVIRAFEKRLKSNNVKILLNTKVLSVNTDDNGFESVEIIDGKGQKRTVKADKCIISTGGMSYKSTGSTGDGYEFAKEMGHSVSKPHPGLIPINIKGNECKEIMGLSLKNVRVKALADGKVIGDEFGEMLFTHFGVSGPCILTLSSLISGKHDGKNIEIVIDLKPALTNEQLEQRIIRDFEMYHNRHFENALDKLLPKSLIPVVVKRSRIDGAKPVNAITKKEREQIVNVLKNLSFQFQSFRDINEAIITKGGVNVKEVNPKTMESKIIRNIYFAGEILDVDAFTGGFNLQIAWSSAYCAAIAASTN